MEQPPCVTMNDSGADGFINTRARLQRLSDARFFSGWITGFVGNQISIRVSDSGVLATGDQLYATLNSAICSATCQVVVTGRQMQDTTMILQSAPAYGRPTEGARYSTEAMTGVLRCGTSEVQLCVGDVSEKGLGGHVPQPLPRGETVEFNIEGLYGNIAGEAEVRYCRQDPARPDWFRIGLLILQVGRIDQARWNRTVGAQAA